MVMANIERINKCIDLMRRAKNLNMRYWQDYTMRQGPEESVRDLHACGNTACFAGYLAISKFFQEEGGTVLSDGSPEWADYCGAEAVAMYLGISIVLARDITVDPHGFWERTCGVIFNKVEPKHVIKVLQMIKKGELE